VCREKSVARMQPVRLRVEGLNLGFGD